MCSRIADPRSLFPPTPHDPHPVPSHPNPAAPPRPPPRSWWFKHTVRHLAARLDQLGSRLILRRAPDSASALRALVLETGAAAVFFNHLYDSISMVRDQQIKDELRCMGVAAHSFNADLLYEPWQVLDDEGQVRLLAVFSSCLLLLTALVGFGGCGGEGGVWGWGFGTGL